jgi:protein phosphatase
MSNSSSGEPIEGRAAAPQPASPQRLPEEQTQPVDPSLADLVGEQTVERPSILPSNSPPTLPSGAVVRDGEGIIDDDDDDPFDPPTEPLDEKRRAHAAALRAEAELRVQSAFRLDQVHAAATSMPSAPARPGDSLFDEAEVVLTPTTHDDADKADGEHDALAERTTDMSVARPRRLRSLTEAGAPDESATVEGAPVVEEHATDVGPPPPAAGHILRADDGNQIRLEDNLGEQAGSVFFRARLGTDEQPFTAVWTLDQRPEPPWARLPDPRIVRPRARASLERAAVRVFERPKGNTVVDYLAEEDRLLPAMATLELGIELAEILEGLHGAGHFVYDLDPSQIVIERGGRVRLYAVAGLYPGSALPTGPLGLFAAPEVRRRLTYLIGAHSDVYAVALLLYALLAKRAPLDVDFDPALLVSPRVFRPECPLGIWPYLKPCLDPMPSRRIGHARGLKRQLERARQRLIDEAQATETADPLVLEAWAEQHTGLGKARRGAAQQDRALSLTDERGRIGLYMIADGVSRSKYGDGAFAAEQVEASALQRWAALEKGAPDALELQHPQRVDVLRQVCRAAGKRIASEVNARCAPLANEPNQVMSATMVASYIVRGEATIGNLGDSRAYLVRDNVIEQISIDHDRCTDALRMGLTFKEAQQVQMGSALTRVVGRVIIDEDGSSRSDPFEPETFRLRLMPGDRLVLCSDGVADFAAGAGASTGEADAKILEALLEHEDPARAAYELVVLANRAGGYDNISCVVIAAHPS